MDNLFRTIKTVVYDKCNFEIMNFQIQNESKDYSASTFTINNLRIISRSAKITPKKLGQFVTFWKRNKKGIIEPFNNADNIDFFIINVCLNNQSGQFVFPKKELIRKGIITSKLKEGKRGFRVYPNWDIPKSKQAIKTQNWQLKYFYEVNESTDCEKVKSLYK